MEVHGSCQELILTSDN